MTATKLTPRPEQEWAIQLMTTEPTKSILLGDDMGFGKTVQACEFMVRLGLKRVLIVGVKDTYDQWAERLLAQSDGTMVLRSMNKNNKAGETALADFIAGKPGYYFAGSQFLAAQDWEHIPQLEEDGTKKWARMKTTKEIVFKKEKDGKIGPRLIPVQESKRSQLNVYRKMKAVDAIIFDEIHMIANRKSVGRKTLVTIKTEWKLAMSGTWYGNLFENSWSVTRWLWKEHIGANFENWKNEWCATEEVYTGKDETRIVVTGEKTPGLFVTTLPCYIRREALEEFPEPIVRYVDLSPRQRQQYTDLEKDCALWLDAHGGGRDMIDGGIPIALRQKLRACALGEMSLDEWGTLGFDYNCRSSKLYELKQLLDEPEWAGRQVAIYMASKRFAKVTVARMRAAGKVVVEWSGDSNSAERAQIKADFLAGKIQYLVCVIQAFNAGLDGFQAVCNRVVWMEELDGDGATNNQALARFFRPGRKGDFLHAKILARDTKDVGIFSKLVLDAMRNRTTLLQAA